MNTRALASQIIFKVCFEGRSLSDAFDQEKILDTDRAFVKEMCFGTIRFWITLQAILKTLLEKPLKNEDKNIECLLCVGLYQILHMHVPEYALVDESVTATRILQKAWASGLVNKILRMAIDLKNKDALKAKGITAEFSHPLWIIEKIQKAYPDRWQSILKANNEKAPLFLRVNQRKISRDDFVKQLNVDYEILEDLPHCVVIKNPTPVEKIPGFFEGYFSVQDASGQHVIDYLDLKPGQFVLDACAAPGSKTTHILETLSKIKKCVAVDLYANRLSKIQDNVARLQLNHNVMKYVAEDVCDIDAWWDGELFDRILVDAPCSASGVIRRHPDIKILRKKMDIPNLAATQLNMLNALWPLLKKDGKLVYTTCSVFPEENSEVIARFLEEHSEARLVVEKQIVPEVGDGFYYAVITTA
ncbi:MAG: 16S rRNA (cytosine(967)-C(5))-methyltransferase RsmB [Coxiellaceae bacterium]|nr:16S rRNA (cytosine(967)-C(5))-methyltransferase RsmB [Coxiellaceae bacterium]